MSCHATVDKLEPAIERRSNPETSVISVHNQPAVHHQVLPGDAARHHAISACLASLAFVKTVAAINEQRKSQGLGPWGMRVGLHSGPVMAGVVGKNKFSYDIWGDTVNTSARFEQACEEGRINISEATHHRVKAYFECTPRGEIEAKNKGMLKMYWLERLKPEYSKDENGMLGNDRLLSMLNLKSI